MNAPEAIRLTNEFKEAVVRLALMEKPPLVAYTEREIRQQTERVAVLEASLRTALLHSC